MTRLWYSPYGTEWEAETREEALEAERDALHERAAQAEAAAKKKALAALSAGDSQ